MEKGESTINESIIMEIGSMESVRAKENNTICLPTTFKVYFDIMIGKFLNGLKN